jgi:hypothetical protein
MFLGRASPAIIEILDMPEARWRVGSTNEQLIVQTAQHAPTGHVNGGYIVATATPIALPLGVWRCCDRHS